MKWMLMRLHKSQKGQTATEYLLILSVVVLSVVSAGMVFRDAVEDSWESLGERVKEMVDVGG